MTWLVLATLAGLMAFLTVLAVEDFVDWLQTR